MVIKFFRDNVNQLLREVDLVEVAKKRGGIQLFVDTTSFEIFLIQKLHIGLRKPMNKYYFSLIGGEYALLRRYLQNFIQVLSDANIELVWIYDGPRGVNPTDAGSQKKKLESRLQTVREDLKVFRNGSIHSDPNFRSLDRGYRDEATPRLFKQEFRAVLRELYENAGSAEADGAASGRRPIRGELSQCLFGKADFQIAKRFHDDNRNEAKKIKPYAVLSGNNDFTVFKNCRWIPVFTIGDIKHFDIGGDLDVQNLEDIVSLPDGKLRHFRCLEVEAERLRNHFGLAGYSYDIFADLAFSCGSSLSTHAFNQLGAARLPNLLNYSLFGRGRTTSLDRANFIIGHQNGRDSDGLFAVPAVQATIRFNRDVSAAIDRCRRYYNLVSDDEAQPKTRIEEEKRLLRKLEDFTFAKELHAVYKGAFWRAINLEDEVSGSGKSIGKVLVPLRKILHRLVSSVDPVREIGLEQVEVPKATAADYSMIDRLPTLSAIMAEIDSPRNLDTSLERLRLVLTHAEGNTADELPRYFETMTPKKAATCYLLRYFLRLNWQRNLGITEKEFYALSCSVLASKVEANDGNGGGEVDVDLGWYAGLRMLPDDRCVTMMEWGQEMYWHLFYIFGSLFGVERECPKASDLFSGSLFSAFYITMIHQGSNEDRRRFGEDDSVRTRITGEISRLFDRYESELKAVVNGIFPVINPLRAGHFFYGQ